MCYVYARRYPRLTANQGSRWLHNYQYLCVGDLERFLRYIRDVPKEERTWHIHSGTPEEIIDKSFFNGPFHWYELIFFFTDSALK